MSDLQRLSFSIEAPLLERLGGLVARHGYQNRSEFLRDLIRSRLVEEEWKQDEEALGTVTLIFDHHARGLSDKLNHLQHHHHQQVLAATHVHLDAHLCAEVILIRGRASAIESLTDEMRRLKGVLHAALSLGSTGQGIR